MRRKTYLVGMLLSLSLIVIPTTAFAFNPYSGVFCYHGASKSAVCEQAKQAPSNPLFGSGSLLDKAIFFISLIGGIAAMILLIIGAFQYVTAAGSAERASSARRTIIYALIGIAIIALAQLIVTYVINNG